MYLKPLNGIGEVDNISIRNKQQQCIKSNNIKSN